jgi:hypothetical protein
MTLPVAKIIASKGRKVILNNESVKMWKDAIVPRFEPGAFRIRSSDVDYSPAMIGCVIMYSVDVISDRPTLIITYTVFCKAGLLLGACNFHPYGVSLMCRCSPDMNQFALAIGVKKTAFCSVDLFMMFVVKSGTAGCLRWQFNCDTWSDMFCRHAALLSPKEMGLREARWMSFLRLGTI